MNKNENVLFKVVHDMKQHPYKQSKKKERKILSHLNIIYS